MPSAEDQPEEPERLAPSAFANVLFESHDIVSSISDGRNAIQGSLTTAWKGSVDTFGLLEGLSGRAWSPEAPSRMLYEACSTVLLIFDAFAVPYLLCWDVPEEEYWMWATWLTRLYWTCDLPMSFGTGYWEQGLRLELRVRAVARHYLRTWFTLDLTFVVLDWVILALPSIAFLRFLRMIRLPVLARSRKHLES